MENTIKDPNEVIMMQPKDIVRLFNISRTTVWRLLEKMKRSQYKHGMTQLSPTLLLVDRAVFCEYLQSLNGKYLTDEK